MVVVNGRNRHFSYFSTKGCSVIDYWTMKVDNCSDRQL